MGSLSPTSSLLDTVRRIPPGRWGVAVSGGADSTCLLRLAEAAAQAHLSLHVLHLDHETRGAASAGDAQFVATLANKLRLPSTVALLSDLLGSMSAEDRRALPVNRSARFRALRLALYKHEARMHSLQGVLLAHHADDQAETVMLRLFRGGGFASLVGMAERTEMGDLTLFRPLLEIRRHALRDYLRAIGQDWREDASNQRDDQARNRARKVLAHRPGLTAALCDVAINCRRLRDWAEGQAPRLVERFHTKAIWNLPEVVGAFAAGEWLRERGVPIDQISGPAVRELLDMCRDAASPARIAMPGGLAIRRRGREVFVD